MNISSLIDNINNAIIDGEDRDIKHLSYNTSNIEEGGLFFCIEGVKADGHTFAQKAVDLGAKAIVISKEVEVTGDVTKVKVKDTREAMAVMACNFYGKPSEKMEIIGVTGTNGKTTSTFMLKAILDNYGKTTGLLGTIFNISGKRVEEAKRTTPESMDLQNIFSNMASEKVSDCIMEVSSHSLELKRVYGVRFKVGIFTNLTQDHLDFHMTMENYFKAKLKLFENTEYAALNIDDEYGRRAADIINQDGSCDIITFGIENSSGPEYAAGHVFARDILITEEGTAFTLCFKEEEIPIKLNMPGKFNVYNALGCTAAAIALGIPMGMIKFGLEALDKVPGRSEKINTKDGVTIVIDYAHSPDGIVNILKTAREYTKGRLITLFGCGGDRDRTKRSIMGKAAGELSDFCIVTSDNPRSEEPLKIIDDILPGINETKCPYVIIADRKEAIKHAVENAKPGDVVIVAGKGHETYQVLKDKTIHFDEREIIGELIANK